MKKLLFFIPLEISTKKGGPFWFSKKFLMGLLIPLIVLGFGLVGETKAGVDDNVSGWV